MSKGDLEIVGTVQCEANGCTKAIPTWASQDHPESSTTPVPPGWAVGQSTVTGGEGRLVVLCPDHGGHLVHGPDHPVTWRGIFWVLMDAGIEIACETGLRKCRPDCSRWRMLQRMMEGEYWT